MTYDLFGGNDHATEAIRLAHYKMTIMTSHRISQKNIPQTKKNNIPASAISFLSWSISPDFRHDLRTKQRKRLSALRGQ
jgi:hypothetical protein